MVLSRKTFPLLGLYSISYLWYSAIGCLSVIIIGMIVSVITGVEDMKKMNPDLISPGATFVMDLMPESVRKMVGWELGTEYVSTTWLYIGPH
jgi:sodium-coupled monocarboxylate transporter 8/12